MKLKIILILFLSLAVATMLVTPAFADDEYEDGAGSDSDGAWGWTPPKGDHFGASDGPAPGSSGDGNDGYGNGDGGGGYGGGGGFFGGRGRFGSSGGASGGASRTKLGDALSRLPSLVTSFFGNNSTIVPSVVQPKPNQENSSAEKEESRGIDHGSKAKASVSTGAANSKSDDLRINELKLKNEPSDDDLSKGT